MYYVVLFTLNAFVFIFGACIASFLNVVIYRVPNKIKIGAGRSVCPKCKKQIRNIDLIPVLNYLFLGGKCHNCKSKISIRYPLVEMLGGVVALLCAYRFDYTAKTIFVFAFCAVLICIAFIDYDTKIIPDRFILILAGLVIVLAFLESDITIIERIIGFFVVSLPLFILVCIIPDCFGGGDIKLLAVAGFGLGYKNILLAFFISLLITGVYLVKKMIKKEFDKKSHIAFGPFLSIGIGVGLLYGDTIINWYLRLYGL